MTNIFHSNQNKYIHFGSFVIMASDYDTYDKIIKCDAPFNFEYKQD